MNDVIWQIVLGVASGLGTLAVMLAVITWHRKRFPRSQAHPIDPDWWKAEQQRRRDEECKRQTLIMIESRRNTERLEGHPPPPQFETYYPGMRSASGGVLSDGGAYFEIRLPYDEETP